MNNKLLKIKDSLIKNKKKIVKITTSLLVLGIITTGATGLIIYKLIKSNINYSMEQAKEIALQIHPGNIVGAKKDLDIDDLSLEYDFLIKDNNNNILSKITVDSRFGAVIKDYDY